MSITTECMVLNLHLGIWTGQRLDKTATANLTANAGADSDAARVNKHLVSKSALKDVSTAANAIRTHFYTRTLPWKDNGDRVISRKAFLKFIEEHEELAQKFRDAADVFSYEQYAVELDRAGFRMGELFDETDYPSAAEVRRRFHITLDIDPVSEAKDFRVQIDTKHADAVRQRMEQASQDRITRAMSSVWDRLTDVVGNYVTRTKAGTGIRVELVNNLREVVDLLPELNIIDDPDIEKIRAMIEDRLVQHDAADLRNDDKLRVTASREAEEIMDKMRGFMSAMGQGD